MKTLLGLVQITLLMLLTGCAEPVELQRNLAESDANEVIAELADKQVEASKRVDKEGVTILVDKADMARSVRILTSAGLPRIAQTTFGEVFRKEGMISTPMEERARYLYALSQELEHTLSLIDGVIKARVHVVLPEKVAPGEPTLPSSAAVFIKHIDTLDPDVILPRVRKMVASSIPGLNHKTHQKLAVVFVPTASYQPAAPLPDKSAGTVKYLTIAVVLLLLLVMFAGALLTNPKLREKLLKQKSTSTEVAVQTDSEVVTDNG